MQYFIKIYLQVIKPLRIHLFTTASINRQHNLPNSNDPAPSCPNLQAPEDNGQENILYCKMYLYIFFTFFNKASLFPIVWLVILNRHQLFKPPNPHFILIQHPSRFCTIRYSILHPSQRIFHFNHSHFIPFTHGK